MSEDLMRLAALKALIGVGDATVGEWEEYTGYAYHLRRRLTDAEQAQGVGEARDLRGTPEARIRYGRMSPLCQKLAAQELGI